MKRSWTVLILFSLLFSIEAMSKTYWNMVLVPANPPFYIDIFETSCKEVGCGWNSSINYKPVRYHFEDAKAYCESIGKRLPTVEEWLVAGSNLGNNKEFTLIGDTLNGQRVNIRGSSPPGSMRTTDFEELGIDAIGTVGMTGNRNEWVIESGGKPRSCGGKYETTDLEEISLKNGKICKPKEKETSGTARCVVDYDDSINIKLNKKLVTGRLESYLKQLVETVNVDELLIPETPITQVENDNSDRLKPKSPVEWRSLWGIQ